jgi:hypothetical protein
VKGRVTRLFGAGEGIRTLDPNLGKVVLRLCGASRQVALLCKM